MKLGIIGTGAYAIAISSLLEEKRFSTIMWTKIKEEYKELTYKHTNLKVIDYKLKNNTTFTTSLEELLTQSGAIIIAIPAKFIKDTIQELKQFYQNQPILIATKGIVENENLLINEYLEKELKTKNIACISGPSFAKDIILKQPIGLTIASYNNYVINYFCNIFSNISYLTLEKENDIIGVELCGILKNIVAIGSGMLKGMNITPSTIANYLYKASKEIQLIMNQYNSNKNTFYTYAGFGDFILTTNNIDSRNYKFGYLIGTDKDYNNYKFNNTIEGLENLDGIYNILKINNINSQLINILYKIIYLNENKTLLLEYLQ